VGDAALLLDPRDVSAWREALSRLVTDESLREDLRVRGRARAAAFTWARTARLTLDVYREALRVA
jgi:glycosyltransferase involved in cell wall biosynthesis